MAEISSLRRHMIEDTTVRNLSPATQQSYLNAASKFSRHPVFVDDEDFSELACRAEFPVHFTITTIAADQSLLRTEID
jgi:integrase/recombinase XerD